MDNTDYDMSENHQDYINRKIADGFAVVFPAKNELQIDIDSCEQYVVFQTAMQSLKRNEFDLLSVKEHESSSGWPCKHITIQLPFEVEPWQRIALQAALGSDPMRELLSCLRMIRGEVHPTLFVEKKNHPMANDPWLEL